MTTTTESKVRSFFDQYRQQKFNKGQILIFSGEISKYVYFICSGKIKKYSTNYKGEDIILATFQEGSFVPVAHAIQQHIPNLYSYAAETDLIVRRAPAKEVFEFLEKNPDAMLSLMRRVYRGLDEMLGRVVTLVATNALGRVVYEVVVAARRFGTSESDEIFIGMSEKGLAARTGLSRETVNREIRKLKELGLVRVERRGIIVKDLDKLEKKLYRELLD